MVRNHHQNSSTVAQKRLTNYVFPQSVNNAPPPWRRWVFVCSRSVQAIASADHRTWKHRTSKSAQCQCPVQEGAMFNVCVCVPLPFRILLVYHGISVHVGPTNYITKPPAGLLDLLAPSHAFHHPPSAKHPQSHCGIMLASPVASGGSGAERHRPTPPKSEMISRVQRTGKELGSRKRIIAYHYANNNVEAKLFGMKHMPMKMNILYVVILPGYAYCT